MTNDQIIYEIQKCQKAGLGFSQVQRFNLKDIIAVHCVEKKKN